MYDPKHVPAKAGRVMQAMLQMGKLDIAQRQQAYEGKQSLHAAATGSCQSTW